MEKSITRVHGVIPRGPSEQVHDKQIIFPPDDYQNTTPFLMLSEDWFGAPRGFETHPHRGMQTVTFVVDGALEHRDHTGGHGVLREGDVQWMTAGRGVMHSEMPHADEIAHTLQLWLNLPAKMKMMPARYLNQSRDEVPAQTGVGTKVLVYAGRAGEEVMPHGSDWPMMMLDIRAEAGRTLNTEVPANYRGFLYVMQGSARLGVNAAAVSAPAVAWFDPSSGSGTDNLTIAADEPFRAVLCAGPPIDEPVAFGGPFVMNTQDEIRQAFVDYRSGKFLG